MKDFKINFIFPKITKWCITLETTIGFSSFDVDYLNIDVCYIDFVILGFGISISWEKLLIKEWK